MESDQEGAEVTPTTADSVSYYGRRKALAEKFHSGYRCLDYRALIITKSQMTV